MPRFIVYILHNKDCDKYYIGQTNDIERRLFEHNKQLSSYTSKYQGVWLLVYSEECDNRSEALKRERFLKKQRSKSFYRSLAGSAG